MIKYNIIIYLFVPFIVCQHQYKSYYDRAPRADKLRVKEFVRVLLLESKYKINQVDSIRNMFANTPAFQVGTIIGTIREKYKSMLIIYKQKENRYLKKANIILPRVNPRRPIQYFMRMEVLSRLELEIDRLVTVLETIQPRMTFKKPKTRRSDNRRWDYDVKDIIKYRNDFFKKLNITTNFKDENDYVI